MIHIHISLHPDCLVYNYINLSDVNSVYSINFLFTDLWLENEEFNFDVPLSPLDR